HVLYQNAADSRQYVDHKRLAEILANVNKYYKGNADSPDMNLSFVLADTDPNGGTMTTPGVEYIRWKESYPIDCDKFMNDDTGKYTSLLWDPNNYINVMVYNFAKTDGGITLGISHLPIIYEGNAIPGLTKYQYPHLGLDNIKFPLCASINSIYINEESANGQYNNADINVTTSHELGHYLGLYHAFSEKQCSGTDYCDDTPNYDRAAYMAQFSGNKTFAELVSRQSCDGTRFESHNIMDYDVSYADRFTPDQRKRVRAVLNYGLMIPGPKFNPKTSGKTTYGAVDIPIVTMR
ncbi:MAG: zinc-dependent metalloproteinase lipoprotein, partial [Rikenellaceae bacterium]|nr:zinc-dependent metalloproteinase lipoprotein [Rikenellaceae bacterium]